MNYYKVGASGLLKGLGLAIYVNYMRLRWPDTEIQKCQDGYAGEWAMRFANGSEYACSDSEGQKLLIELYKKYAVYIAESLTNSIDYDNIGVC